MTESSSYGLLEDVHDALDDRCAVVLAERQERLVEAGPEAPLLVGVVLPARELGQHRLNLARRRHCIEPCCPAIAVLADHPVDREADVGEPTLLGLLLG